MTIAKIETKNPDLGSRIINKILSIEPIADFAKDRARNMMIKRAEKIGVPWRENVQKLQERNWESEKNAIENPQLQYPEYYLTSFHAYEEGNLSWKIAFETESAAKAVHAKIWPELGAQGDDRLRQSYHEVLLEKLPIEPKNILDLGCSVGMSTFSLQQTYPRAKVTGLDLSPYCLAVARYNSRQNNSNINWLHAVAEETGLADGSFDLVSACLIFHEVPQKPTKAIFSEARRLLRSGGYFTIMDMNPNSAILKKMPPYVFTLLKSTEPYLDDYFSLEIDRALIEAGFESIEISYNSPRHRTIVARAS